ncbi:alpha/beta hydrolase [Sporosarcina cascadiensis]|uniref:alpha/beta hydrolase n=1 Tax=Sporosarcina cascadiensis TaxID=2660747 RepID=UPI00129A92A3|nr:alpha/beta hydrolase [Sporosarcina cascadiensis]
MKFTQDQFFKTSDGAYIYFEDIGKGRPLILMPGFLATTQFFERNVSALSKHYRVITFDPRGQGRSSKSIGNNTVIRNALDIKELVDHLRLEDVVIGGWSLASSVVVSYAKITEAYKLKGLILIDGSLHPFSDHQWNKHRSRSYDVDNWLQVYMPLYHEADAFYNKFIQRISNGKMSDDDRNWIINEFKLTPPWTALELHYDFCQTDNFKTLASLSVPVSIFGGDSNDYGLDMVDAYAKEIKGYSEINKFYKSGHMMFYYEADKFNTCVMLFMEKVHDKYRL